jgi:hypothetical protein
VNDFTTNKKEARQSSGYQKSSEFKDDQNDEEEEEEDINNESRTPDMENMVEEITDTTPFAGMDLFQKIKKEKLHSSGGESNMIEKRFDE